MRVNAPKRLTQEDLDELENAILDVYQDWLGTNDRSDDGYVYDTEYHRWVSLEDFITSIIYRGVNPNFFTELSDKISKFKNKDKTPMSLIDYIETYHWDWVENLATKIRKEIPYYFGDEEDKE